MYEYVSAEKWREFEERFRYAAAFLLSAGLDGELRYLRSVREDGQLNDWQKNRLEELEAVEKQWADIRAARKGNEGENDDSL